MTASTYTNPILNTDWPDLDAIRVDDTYYLVASSINRVPGVPILSSPDLVSWSIVGHALPVLQPAEHFSLPRHGGGAWAPSIRHHDGLFHIFVPDPDHGIQVTTSEQAEGPWSAPHLIMPGLGLIDPVPFWDDDGRAWIVFGWAKSRSGLANRLSLVEMAPDARSLISAPVTLIDGDDHPGLSVLEGPKLYKRDGWYWIFAPAGGVVTGWQSVFRSRSLTGPYETRVVLATGSTDVNGPHQGAWLTSREGEDWFLHFQDRGVFGRVVHLQPMAWDDDGWPIIGDNGEPVTEHPLPAAAVGRRVTAPVRDDAWQSTELGLQWHWQANPRADWFDLRGDGLLRLRGVASDAGSLRGVPQVLGQQLPGVASEFSTSVCFEPTESAEASGATTGARAGVVVLGTTYAWLGLAQTAGPDGTLSTVLRAGRFDGSGDEEQTDLAALADGETVELRVRSDDRGVCDLDYRRTGGGGVGSGGGGGSESDSGEWMIGLSGFRATPGHWISAELGLFAASPLGSPGERTAAFGPVTVTSA